jgi:hypothetical protein
LSTQIKYQEDRQEGQILPIFINPLSGGDFFIPKKQQFISEEFVWLQ